MPTDLSLPITSWAAIANATLLLVLTYHVVRHRRSKGIVLGDGDERAVAKAIRGHANAAEQIPIALVLMAMNELQGASGVVLSVLAVLFTVGRVLHGSYFAGVIATWRARFWGMLMTLIAQGGLIILLLVTQLS